LDNWLRIYAWFLLAVTALPAVARLLKPRELAQIMLARYQNPKRRKRARIGGLIYLVLALLAVPFLWRSALHQQRWLIMALLVGAVSAVEFIWNSRSFDQGGLESQNRYFGGVYAAIAIAVALLLLTR
jgi:UDP-N-acetylmuramyl pentapeptide phosphotransferase/UDP-N-acetylglucosamine-1-phosphate transferase